MIGLIHSQPAPGASKLAHAAVKLVIAKTINIICDRSHALGAVVRVFKASQPCGLFAGSAQPPVTIDARQCVEQPADACNG
jgi:hypothetical protein